MNFIETSSHYNSDIKIRKFPVIRGFKFKFEQPKRSNTQTDMYIYANTKIEKHERKTDGVGGLNPNIKVTAFESFDGELHLREMADRKGKTVRKGL